MSGGLSDVESVHTTLIPTDTQSTGSQIVLIFFLNLLNFHMVFYFDCIVGRLSSRPLESVIFPETKQYIKKNFFLE